MNKAILIIMQHIAISDLAFSISIVLPANISLFANSWVLGDFMCKARVYISYTVHSAALFLVAFLTTYKLLILKNPNKTAFSSTKVVNLGCLIIWLLCCIIRVVATTPRKDPQPNISDLRDHSQSIFRPILTRVQKKKKKKKKKKKLPPLYIDQLKCGIRPPRPYPPDPPPPDAFWGTTL